RCLFVARHTEEGPRLSLLFPPLGTSPEQALPECVKLLRAVNGRARAKIMWIDAEDASALRGLRGLRLRSKGTEYWYRPDQVVEARGRRFHTLRRQIRRIEGADFGLNKDAQDEQDEGLSPR